MKRVILISGGIDSYIMSQEYEGKNVYVDFGQKYAKEEKNALDQLGVEYDCIDIKSCFEESEIFINDRNLLLATLVSLVYSPDEIYMAGLLDDNCVDKNETEFEIMSSIISRYSKNQVKVISPYWKKTKGDIIQGFSKKEMLKKTFSCYTPIDGKECGNCPACLRKAIALETNGIKSNINLSDDIIRQYLKKIHLYNSDRISRFFIYLRKRKRVIAVDIDGILCEETNKPYMERLLLDKTDSLYAEDCYVVLFSARLENDRKTTEEWLYKNGITYDALILNKLPYDLLIDDKSVSKMERK